MGGPPSFLVYQEKQSRHLESWLSGVEMLGCGNLGWVGGKRDLPTSINSTSPQSRINSPLQVLVHIKDLKRGEGCRVKGAECRV